MVNLEQFENICQLSFEPSLIQFSAFHTALVSLLQLEKASFPILVMLSGITTLVKPPQLEKALFPIDVTLLGITTLVKPPQ